MIKCVQCEKDCPNGLSVETPDFGGPVLYFCRWFCLCIYAEEIVEKEIDANIRRP